jgi:CBS domain-containing protein
VNEKTTVEECLDLLVSKKILSVPIYDLHKKTWVGIIDMYQIMTFMAFVAYSPDTQISLESVLEKVDLSKPVVSLLGSTGMKESDDIYSLWILSSNSSIKEPMEYLGKGIYRILVTSEDLNFAKIITQTDLIRFIHKNWDQFGDYKNCSLKDNNSLVSFIKHVHTVHSNTPAIQGFQLMRLKQVNALAVVNGLGHVISTLSDADLRGLTHSQLSNLFLSIEEYLSWAHKGEVRKPVVCQATDKLKTVVDLLVNEKVHRVWVVDAEMKPIGVVSMTDIALYFYSNTLEIWYYPDNE